MIIIMRDLCLQQPDYSKIPEIYAKLLRRMDDDDEGVKVFLYGFVDHLMLGFDREVLPICLVYPVVWGRHFTAGGKH